MSETTSRTPEKRLSMRVEALKITLGETPLGKLTVATHSPRRPVAAVAVRLSTWKRIAALLDACDKELWVINGDHDGARDETHNLRAHARRLEDRHER